MRAQGLPRRLRLRRRREFLHVQTKGRKYHVANFLVFVLPTPTSAQPEEQASSTEGGRLGVTVTRKVGGAVVRNRIKRFVREAFRRERGVATAGLDIVLVAKRDAARVGYGDVLTDVRRLRRKLSRPQPGAGT